MRCLELRWLGIHPTIELEVAYFDRIRGPGRHMLPLPVALARSLARRLTALLAARVDAADDRVDLVSIEDDSIESGVVLAHPACEVCAKRDRLSQTVTDRHRWSKTPHRAAPSAACVLERYSSGPVPLAQITPAEGSRVAMRSPLLHVAVARFALPEPETVTGAQSNWSHGSSAESLQGAEQRAVVEALERYCGLSRPLDSLWSTYDSISAHAIRPTDLPLFSPSQYRQSDFPFKRFRPDRPLRWSVRLESHRASTCASADLRGLVRL